MASSRMAPVKKEKAEKATGDEGIIPQLLSNLDQAVVWSDISFSADLNDVFLIAADMILKYLRKFRLRLQKHH